MKQDNPFLLALSSYALTLGLLKRFTFNKIRYDRGLPQALAQALEYCGEAISAQRSFSDALVSLDATSELGTTLVLLETTVTDSLYKCHHALLETSRPEVFASVINLLDELRRFWSDNTAKHALSGSIDSWDLELQLERTRAVESAILVRMGEI